MKCLKCENDKNEYEFYKIDVSETTTNEVFKVCKKCLFDLRDKLREETKYNTRNRQGHRYLDFMFISCFFIVKRKEDSERLKQKYLEQFKEVKKLHSSFKMAIGNFKSINTGGKEGLQKYNKQQKCVFDRMNNKSTSDLKEEVSKIVENDYNTIHKIIKK